MFNVMQVLNHPPGPILTLSTADEKTMISLLPFAVVFLLTAKTSIACK